MSIQIKLKNSVVQDSTPSASDLPAVGEIALNANINSIGGFMRASDNSIVKIFGPGSLSTPTATTTVSGISELATNSETTTGTATNRVVTPAGLNAVTVAERSTSNTNYVAKAGSTLTGVLTMPNGSNSAPAINFGDSDSGIFGGTNTVSLAAGGTTRLTADTGVSVVGTLAVTGAITSTSDLTIPDKIIHSGDTNTAIRFPAADTVSVETGGSEAFRVDSSGRLLVGTSSARVEGNGFAASFQIEGTGFADSSQIICRNQANNAGANLILQKSRGSTLGSQTILLNNDTVGSIVFEGSDGVNTDSIASILAAVDGTPGTNDMPGRLVFSTTADGAASPTTRLTIDSAGLVKIPDDGKFVAGGSSDLQIYHEAGAHSFIKNTSGRLRIIGAGGTDEDIQINAKNGEFSVRAVPDAQVELYFDHNKKFETTSAGATVTGTITATSFVGETVVGDPSPQLGNSLDMNGQSINGGDSAGVASNRIKLGVGDDLQLFHDGSDSVIKDAGTGRLSIQTSHLQVANAANSETIINAFENGAVELYYDNSVRLTTASTGLTINGGFTTSHHCTFGGNILFDADNTRDIGSGAGRARNIFLYQNLDILDNGEIRMGNADDLTITHDGSNSRIKNTTGSLWLQSDTAIRFVDAGINESMAAFYDNAAVELYFDGSKKFETLTGGAKITGTATATGSLIVGSGNEFQVTRSSGNTEIQNYSGTLLFGNASSNLNAVSIKARADENSVVCVPDAQVALYFNNAQKLETTSGGVSISGNLIATGNLNVNDNGNINVGNSGDLQLFHNGTNSFIDSDTGNLVISSVGDLRFNSADYKFMNTADSETLARFIQDGQVQLYSDNSLKFNTQSGGVQFYGSLFADDNNKIQLGNDQDLRLYHDSSNSYIQNITGALRVYVHTLDVRNDAGNEKILVGNANGSVELYYNNIKILTTGSGGSVDANKGQIDIQGKIHTQLGDNGINTFNKETTGDQIRFNTTGTSRGSISSNGSTVAFNTSFSDKSMKKNFENWTEDTLALFKNIKPQRFNYLDQENGTEKEKGFIAQDMLASFPEAYQKNDNDKYMFNPSGMVVYLMKAIQELEAEVAALKAA